MPRETQMKTLSSMESCSSCQFPPMQSVKLVRAHAYFVSTARMVLSQPRCARRTWRMSMRKQTCSVNKSSNGLTIRIACYSLKIRAFRNWEMHLVRSGSAYSSQILAIMLRIERHSFSPILVMECKFSSNCIVWCRSLHSKRPGQSWISSILRASW